MKNHVYALFPTAYADTLRSKGHRDKARAFWEYFYDMEKGEHNSVRFYAKSWGIGKSTAHDWVQDFNLEIDLYLSAWYLKNKAHYAHAEKSTGHSGHQEPDTSDGYTTQETGVCEEVAGRSGHQEPDKGFNLNDNHNTGWWNDRDFNDLFFIYSQNTKFPGKKEEAYEAFRFLDVDVSMIKLAAVQYLHDPATTERRFNLANFLKNQTYLPYMPKHLNIVINGEWVMGVYDDINAIFKSNDREIVGELTSARLVELFKCGELQFINPKQRRTA